MFMTMCSKIPDVSRYLSRIHIEGYGEQGHSILSREFLDELIYRHQCSVPFENIEIYDDKQVPSLEIEDLYDKIVLRNRGGYCFELNALFHALLVELGFDAYPCLTQEWETTPQPPVHQGTVVKLDNELLYCDVGFGGPIPAWAFKIEDGYRETRYGDTFKFDKIDEWYWMLSRCKKLESPTGEKDQFSDAKHLTVCLFPQAPVNFIAPNFYCATLENSYFTEQRLVNLKTDTGHLSITNMQFKKRDGSEVYTEELQSQESLNRVLKEYFSIVC